jgi:hypothetical protein
MPIPLLIHIGYHKTGTSFLQKYLFNAETIGFCSPYDGHFIKDQLVLPHPFVFNPQKARQTLLPDLRIPMQHNLVPVLSHERFVGALNSSGRDSIPLAQRLAVCFPEARILMVIREQSSMLFSSYNQYVRSGGTHTLRRYLKALGIDKNYGDVGEFDLIRFNYDYLIQIYYDLFGREKVLVLPYELFRDQPQEFVTQIVQFCGLLVRAELIAGMPYTQVVNPALSPISIRLKRCLNYGTTTPNAMNGGGLFPSKRNNDKIKRGLSYLDRHLPESWKNNSKSRMEASIQHAIGNRYAESNAQTQRLTGLDLKQYGYQTPQNKDTSDTPDLMSSDALNPGT